MNRNGMNTYHVLLYKVFRLMLMFLVVGSVLGLGLYFVLGWLAYITLKFL